MSPRVRRVTRAPLVRAAVMAGLAAAVACGTQDDHTPAAHVAPVAAHDSARLATAAESVAVARDQWNVPEVVRRLTEAGFVVTDRGTTVRHSGFHRSGEVLDVSGSELQTYIYDDAKSRALDSATLDTTSSNGLGIGVPKRPHVIINNNLIAFHLTGNSRMAQRVHDALMARHLER